MFLPLKLLMQPTVTSFIQTRLWKLFIYNISYYLFCKIISCNRKYIVFVSHKSVVHMAQSQGIMLSENVVKLHLDQRSFYADHYHCTHSLPSCLGGKSLCAVPLGQDRRSLGLCEQHAG